MQRPNAQTRSVCRNGSPLAPICESSEAASRLDPPGRSGTFDKVQMITAAAINQFSEADQTTLRARKCDMSEDLPKRTPRQVYAFIDTNIFLDFYRQSSEATLRLLERLKPVKDRIICTYQVEMEFLRNRQSVLLEAIREMKSPEPSSPPALFADSKTSKSLRKTIRKAKDKGDLIRQRAVKLLERPRRDPVYQVLETIFQSTSSHVLTRDMSERSAIKRRAWRRFALGYPPRKSNDTSAGDALNWEWIVHCASKLQGRMVIVSRDGDYGVCVNKRYFLNDQLRHEFRQRVGRKSVMYTHKLSDALKQLAVSVPDDEVEAEAKALQQPEKPTDSTRELYALLESLSRDIKDRTP